MAHGVEANDFNFCSFYSLANLGSCESSQNNTSWWCRSHITYQHPQSILSSLSSYVCKNLPLLLCCWVFLL